MANITIPLDPYYVVLANEDGSNVFLATDSSSGYPYWASWDLGPNCYSSVTDATESGLQAMENSFMQNVTHLRVGIVHGHIEVIELDDNRIIWARKIKALSKLTPYEKEALGLAD